jgi:N-acetylglucosamine-6-phosphate deacetylase
MKWLRGRLLLADRLVEGALGIEGGRIVEIAHGPRAGGEPELCADIVAPGFIDLQINGGFGVDVAEDGAGAVAELGRRLPATGVTAFLPTLVSSAPELYRRAGAMLVAGKGARAIGLHLEGPFLSPARAGAHPRGAIEEAESARGAIEALIAAGAVRLVTLAPERPGALEMCRSLAARGVSVSLGHTDATWAEMRAGIDAGAVMVTHLYNAMSPFHHREPGAVGTALSDDRVAVGIIADPIHCHPAALRLALAAKGPGRVALVTDAMAAAGMPPGEYALGARQVTVSGGACRLADGTLAGSILTLDAAVRAMVSAAGAAVGDALRMASAVPARLAGLSGRKGALATGMDADLVLLDESLAVQATFVAGERVH